MTYTREFFGVAEDVDFDLQAAIDAYEWVMDNPDTAAFVVSKALFDYTTADLHHHRDEVSKVVAGYIAKRADDLKRGMVRELISKSASQESIEAISKAAEMVALISKDYTTWERQRNVERQLRDAGGRFRVMRQKITAPKQKVGHRTAIAAGVPEPQGLSGRTKDRFRSDYIQVANMLRELSAMKMPDDTMVTAVYRDRSGNETVANMSLAAAKAQHDDRSSAANGLVRSQPYRDGKTLREVEATISTGPDASGPAQAFDVLGGLSRPGFAAYVAGNAPAAGQGLRNFGTSWNQNQALDADALNSNSRFWRRTEAAAELANTLGGDLLPPKAQLALKTAAWAGQHAPEAEKVIGPAARKASYRYRGVEKQPDPIFQDTINRKIQEYAAKGKTKRDAHDALIMGEYVETPRGGRPGSGLVPQRRESDLIRAMKARLPDKDLYELNRKSGTIPPSQGIIINRSGKVITEAVGYGEDWYLPFNLKNVNRLRGGEYIRTRAFGGPTTEDIYTGLVSGARGLTVVSHSGVFHVQFDDTFRGNRRYNDKAARMVKRYGMLLDAVQSQQVRLGDVPGDRKAELRTEAEYFGERGTTAFDNEYQRLLRIERANPRLSNARKAEIKQNLLDDYAREKEAPDWSTFVLRQRPAVEALVRRDHPNTPDADISGIVEQRLNEYQNVDRALSIVGLKDKADRETESAQRLYEASLNPLMLDGVGYESALRALKDQFPYYIASYYFEPLKGKTDQGYVKPRFNRPEGALAGYYDTSIQGVGVNSAERTGKFTADQTNYQNWSVRGRDNGTLRLARMDNSPPKTSDEGNTAPARERAAEQPTPQTKNDARLKLVESIRAQTRYSDKAVGLGPLAGKPIPADLWAKGFTTSYPKVMTAPDVLRRDLANDPEGVGRALDAELTEIRNRALFDLPQEVWDSWDSGGVFVPKPVPRGESGEVLVGQVISGVGRTIYDVPETRDARPDKLKESFDRLMRQPGHAERLGITATTLDDPADVVLERLRGGAANLGKLVADNDTWRRNSAMGRQPAPDHVVASDAEWLAKVSSVALRYKKAQEAEQTLRRHEAERAAQSAPQPPILALIGEGVRGGDVGEGLAQALEQAGGSSEEIQATRALFQSPESVTIPGEVAYPSEVIKEPEEPKKS